MRQSSETTLAVRNGNWSLKLDEVTQRMHIAATVKGEVLLQLELEAGEAAGGVRQGWRFAQRSER
jgi:hypothetical protein